MSMFTPKKEVTELCNKAMAAIERNDVSKAFQDLTREEALDPRNPFVHLLLHQSLRDNHNNYRGKHE